MTRFGFALLLSMIFLLSVQEGRAQERTIHYFGIYCDGYEGEGGAINEGVTKDRLMMDSLFDSNYSESSWGVKLSRSVLHKKDAIRENVEKRLSELAEEIGPEDTVYVHFSGHGVIPDRSKGEQFLQDVNENLFSRKELADALSQMPCRLRILVTDCCSTYPPSVIIAEGDEDVLPWKNTYMLFVEHTGFVDITAASPGQPAYGTQYGGFLTVNLHSDMQRYPTWEEVFHHTRGRVEEETKEIVSSERGARPGSLGGGIKVTIDTKGVARNSEELDQFVQRPFAYSLGTPTGRDLPERVSFVLPESQTKLMEPAVLECLDLQQLYLARNEIFARHGYEFSTAFLADYFSSLSWYQVRKGFKSPKLSSIEARNVELIRAAESALGGSFIGGGDSPINRESVMDPAGEFRGVFPHSSRDVIPRTSVQALSQVELSIARNEIYARHGYAFSSPVLKRYFAKMPGYESSGSSSEPDFNSVEETNLWLIRKIERIKGGTFQW